jgi:acyl-homoserine-lactone acylase
MPVVGLLLLIVSAAVVVGQEGPRPPGQADPSALERMERMARAVTISRETYGVPHVFGPTDASVIFGAAYARAEDRLPEDEGYFLLPLGRGAEIAGESAVQWDTIARALEIPQQAQAEYASAPPGIRALAEAFADGLNDYLLKHPQVRLQALVQFEPWHLFAFYRMPPPPRPDEPCRAGCAQDVCASA